MSAPATRQNPTLSPVQAQVVAALARGLSRSAAAREAGIHRSTIYDWQESNPAFNEALEQATEDYRAVLRDQLLDLSSKALDTLENILSDPKAPAGARLRASLAVLTRPTYPEKGWTLPAPVNTAREEQLMQDFAALKHDYDAFRMTETLSKAQRDAA